MFKQTKDFAHLRFLKQQVTLGFYRFDKIDDPENLLEGEGNTLKHLRIREMADNQAAMLAGWLRAIAE
jgi:hypothetical protein